MRSRRTSACVLGLGLASLAYPAWGGVVTSNWTGNISDQWTTAANWANSDSSTRFPANDLNDTFVVSIGPAGVAFTSNVAVTVASISMTDPSSTLNVDGPARLEAATTTAVGSIVIGSAGRLNAGTFTMPSGNLQVYGTLGVSSSSIGAGIGGNGTIEGTLDCSNLLDPTGILSITGGVILHNSIPDPQEQKSELVVSVKDTSSFDQLVASGSAALAGRLREISLPDGSGSIQSADTFTIVSASSITGGFENVASGQRIDAFDGDDNLAGSFRVNYGAGSAYASNLVVLDNFQSVPEPGALTMLAAGLPLALRRRTSR